MPRICAICGKGKQMGNTRKLLRGHYNITGRRAFKPNLQKTTYQGEKVLACVKCIKTQHKSARA
ncbi:MAG: bL28 family ribosomal protein [Candidatus Andersenbacteria bacterium]|nr:bL28 family ribosomal protein [bacterium]MDZ4225763.1 bL28 family ribosomal protein [Candidatus Andersenbacteria bacterium]